MCCLSQSRGTAVASDQVRSDPAGALCRALADPLGWCNRITVSYSALPTQYQFISQSIRVMIREMKHMIWISILLQGVPAAAWEFGGAMAGAEWRVRDVAAGSGFVTAGADGIVPRLGLTLRTSSPVGSPAWGSTCKVTDTRGCDRAVTLAFCVPFDARGGVWWDNPCRSRRIAGRGQYADLVDNGLGATGYVSRYPLAVISKDDKALCLALPIEPPRMARLLYDAERRELRAEFDLGLSKDCEHFPSCADASVTAFGLPRLHEAEAETKGQAACRVDACSTSPMQWTKQHFRLALEHYWNLFPEAFKRRVGEGGTWLPFQPVSTIEKPEDFGFAFHEVALTEEMNGDEDEKLGIGTFVYTEPMTNWRKFRGPGPKSYSSYMSQLTEDALNGDRSAQATLTSGVKLANGRYFVYLAPVAYTPLSPFGVNCDPEVPTSDWPGWPNRAQFEMERLAKALGWTDQPGLGLDGVYVDSMESGWSQGNYRRDHWRTTRYPLTFDPASKRVCLANFWGNYAFIKDLSAKLHARNQHLMGNDAFYRSWFLAPLVDIPGREYAWYEGDRWMPVPDERYLFFRSMAGRKPYLMLMNNDFTDGSHMEEYFQRSLFWAVYPSMFHGHKSQGEVPYFYNPEWYNRDRELFRKYIPLIRRLDSAGWEPVTYAEATPAFLRVERYGRLSDNNLAFALHNPSAKPVRATLRFPSIESTICSQQPVVTEWITGKSVPTKAAKDAYVLRLDLPANGYAVVGVGSEGTRPRSN